jgi:branched-chain amino acid transport system substrate-binding protein
MSEVNVDPARPLRRWLATAAPIAALAIVLAGCTPTAEPTPTPEPVEPRNLTLQLGSLLPQTGSFATFGPATAAALALAVDDVNSADVGIEIVHEARDSGDATSDVSLTSTTELLDLDTTVIIGPVSDGVSKKVIAAITGAGVLQISPGNTAPDFTRFADDGLYWRTAPSCALEGTAMGQQIFDDGAKTLGVLAQADFCGPVLQQALVAQFERAGGEVVVEETFESTAGSLTEQNAVVVDADPDAVVLITQKQANLSVPDLLAGGYEGADLYFVGLPLGDHSSDLGGSIVGSHASLPGLDIAELDDFTDRLLELDPSLTDFSFAAETYDAVVLAALGALAANDTSGAAIAEHLRAVSGGTGKGEVVSDFDSAAELILAGQAVDYEGFSGSITFDESGDPRGAIIGIYEYEDDNTWTRLR